MLAPAPSSPSPACPGQQAMCPALPGYKSSRASFSETHTSEGAPIPLRVGGTRTLPSLSGVCRGFIVRPASPRVRRRAGWGVPPVGSLQHESHRLNTAGPILSWEGSKSTSKLDGEQSHRSVCVDMPARGTGQGNCSTSTKLLKYLFPSLSPSQSPLCLSH